MASTLCKTFSTYVTVFYIRITLTAITVVRMSGYVMIFHFKMRMRSRRLWFGWFMMMIMSAAAAVFMTMLVIMMLMVMLVTASTTLFVIMVVIMMVMMFMVMLVATSAAVFMAMFVVMMLMVMLCCFALTASSFYNLNIWFHRLNCLSDFWQNCFWVFCFKSKLFCCKCN